MKWAWLFICSLLAWNVNGSTWYVDNSLTGSANLGTTWADAWTNFSSIDWWLTYHTTGVRHGDTLQISGGPTGNSQSYPETLTVVNDPSTSGWLTIEPGQDASHNGTVIFDGGNAQRSGIAINTHQVWVNGQVNGDKQRHFWFKDIQVTNTTDPNTVVLTTKAILGQASDHCIAEYLYATNCDNGIEWRSGGTNIVRYCKLVQITGDAAICMQGSTGEAPGANWIHDNEISISSTNWFYSYGADACQIGDACVVSNNIIYMTAGTHTHGQHCDGVQMMGSNNRIVQNTFTRMSNSALKGEERRVYAPTLVLLPLTNSWFCNNTIRYTSPDDGSAWDVSQMVGNYARGVEMFTETNYSRIADILIANNTFVDLFGPYTTVNFNLSTFAAYGSGDATITNITILNNCMFDCGYADPAKLIKVDAGPNVDSASITVDYNNVAPGSHGVSSIQVNGVPVTQTHGNTTTPIFMSYSCLATNNNFQLSSADTAAKSKGIDLSAYFLSDLVGNPRHVPWDIGAYSVRTVGRVTNVRVGNLIGK